MSYQSRLDAWVPNKEGPIRWSTYAHKGSHCDQCLCRLQITMLHVLEARTPVYFCCSFPVNIPAEVGVSDPAALGMRITEDSGQRDKDS